MEARHQPSSLELELMKLNAQLTAFAAPSGSRFAWPWQTVSPDQLLAEELIQKLKLEPFMGRDELIKTLLILESIPLSPKATYQTLGEYLSSEGIPPMPSVHHTELAAFKKELLDKRIFPMRGTLNPDRPLAGFLTKLHTLLNLWHQSTITKANDHDLTHGNSLITYTPEMLKESQANNELIEYTARDYPSDSSRITPDILRKSVTIERRFIRKPDDEDVTDTIELDDDSNDPLAKFIFDQENHPYVLDALEQFTGDQLSDKFSQAHKLYYFGGQQIYATLGNEFRNSTVNTINSEAIYNIQRTVGHIDWFKDESNHIKANIKVQIYSCLELTTGQSCAIGSDGSTLIHANNDHHLEVIMEKGAKQNILNPYTNMLPVAEIHAELTLKNEHGEYHLEISNMQIKYNTPELTSKYDPALQIEDKKEIPFRPM